MSRTFGAAIGAVIFVLFLAMIATRLAPSASTSQSEGVAVTVSQR